MSILAKIYITCLVLAIPAFLSMWFVDDEESLYCHIVTAFGSILLLIAFMWVIVQAIITIWT